MKQYKLKEQLSKVKSQLNNNNKSKSSKFNLNINNDNDEMNDNYDDDDVDNLSTSDISQTDFDQIQNIVEHEAKKQKTKTERNQEIILKSKTWKIEKSKLKFADEKLKKQIDSKIGQSVGEI